MAASNEIRFETDRRILAVLDGYCSGTGKCRTTVINDILRTWADAKLLEATMVCRVAGVNPTGPETDRK